jgi:hypothetical protein
MTYKYYKFPNKQSVPPRNKWPKKISITEIGPINLDGWYVNVCYQGSVNSVNLEFVKEYEIEVNTPIRKWMGQP